MRAEIAKHCFACSQDKSYACSDLGVPEYVEQSVGDFTSEMIVHYIRFDAFIVLIDIDKHPPFVLPTIEKLSYQS